MKLKKWLKWITIICLVVIFIEVCYLVFQYFKRESKIVHFDGLNQLVAIKDGYLGGGSSDFSSSYGNKKTGGYEKAKLAIYDSKFRLRKEKEYEKGYNTTFNSVAELKDGYLAVGSGEFTKEQNENKLRDALIVKYDFDGNIVWEKKFQIISNARFMKVHVEEDGFVVVGQSLFAPMELGIRDDGGALLIKYDFEGNEIFRANYGGTKSAIYNDFVKTEDGYYTVGKDGYNTGILVKYNLNGERLWVKNYSYTDKVGFSAIKEKEGQLYIVGAKMENSEDNNLDTMALLVKYDLDGKLLLERTFQGTLMERYHNFSFDSDGNLIAVGVTNVKDQKASTETKNEFRYNGLLAKYDSKGKEVYVKEFGGSKDDYFNDLVLVDGHYVVVSYTNSKDRDFKGIGNGKDFKTKFITFDPKGTKVKIQ